MLLDDNDYGYTPQQFYFLHKIHFNALLIEHMFIEHVCISSNGKL